MIANKYSDPPRATRRWITAGLVVERHVWHSYIVEINRSSASTIRKVEHVMPGLSSRLAAIVDALPVRPGMRVLEIGCGPGAAAREIAQRVGRGGYVLGIDRSRRAIDQARKACAAELEAGLLSLRQVSIEDLELDPGELPFDLAFAVRVGALDGRHPETEGRALERIANCLRPNGRFFTDTGEPLREIELNRRSVVCADAQHR